MWSFKDLLAYPWRLLLKLLGERGGQEGESNSLGTQTRGKSCEKEEKLFLTYCCIVALLFDLDEGKSKGEKTQTKQHLVATKKEKTGILNFKSILFPFNAREGTVEDQSVACRLSESSSRKSHSFMAVGDGVMETHR